MPFNVSGGLAAIAYVMRMASLRLGDPKVPTHIAAFPFSFFLPATVLLSSFSGTRSAAQEWADLYSSQKAVFPVTGSDGKGFSLVVSFSLGAPEHPARRRTAILTTAFRQLRLIALTSRAAELFRHHSMPFGGVGYKGHWRIWSSTARRDRLGKLVIW